MTATPARGEPAPAERSSPAARARIVDAAIRTLIRDGVDASMAAIAVEAGVSKALLHYHYTDRRHLLLEVVHRLAHRITTRESAAVGAAESTGVVDALWRSMQHELHLGELRLLLELGTVHEAELRAAMLEAHDARHGVATATVERVFGGLGIAPRMPSALLATVSMALVDGLAISPDRRDARASFDLLWLALLDLTE